MRKRYLDSRKIAKAAIAWVSEHRPDKCWALTLTFNRKKGKRAFCAHEATRTLRHFQRVMNRKAFGNRSKPERGGRELFFWNAREGSDARDWAGPRLHYHVLIEQPPHVTAECWVAVMREAWTALEWGSTSPAFHAQPVFDNDGALAYMAKLHSKTDQDLLDMNDYCAVSMGR